MKYMRSEHDRERLIKLYKEFGDGVFTAPDVKEKCFSDFTSGVIQKWGASGVLERVGKMARVQVNNENKKLVGAIGIWKLTKSTIRDCQKWIGEK